MSAPQTTMREAPVLLGSPIPVVLPFVKNRPRFVWTNNGGAGLLPPLMMESLLRVRAMMLVWTYAARVLLFPDRAAFAFLADFVATNPVSVGAAAAALPPELSTDVVRISR